MICPACGSNLTVYLADGLWRCMACDYIFEAGEETIEPTLAEMLREARQVQRERPR